MTTVHPTDTYIAATSASVIMWELLAYWLMTPGFTISQRVNHYWAYLGPLLPLAYIGICVGGFYHFFGWRFWPQP